MHRLVPSLYITVLLLLFSCGSSVTDSGGSSIEVVGIRGQISGKVLTADSLPSIESTALLVNPRTLRTISKDETTTEGAFSLGIKEVGHLGVVVYDSLQQGFYATVKVSTLSDSIDLDTIILQEMGTISGVVSCEKLLTGAGTPSGPENYMVVIPEIAQMVAVQETGEYWVPSVPAGEYTLQVQARTLGIQPSIALYDTTIAVKSGALVTVDTIELKEEVYHINDSLHIKDTAVVREILDANGDTSGVRYHIANRRNRIAHLYLSDIATIPEAIQKLDSLEQIVIRGGSLTEFPAVISECQTLQRIVVHHTKLDSLPMELSLLERLTMLELTDNCFKELPEVVKEMPGIPVLKLERNNIQLSEDERSWLLQYRFDNDTLQLFDWEKSQTIHNYMKEKTDEN